MKLKHIISTLIVAATMSTAAAAESYIELKSTNETIKPANNNMTATSDGTISFTDIYGQKHAYRRSQIKYVFSDCPKDVNNIERYFRAQQFAKVIAAVDKLSAQEVWLGWGGFAMYLKAMAQVQLNQLAEADATLKKAVYVAKAERRDDLIKGGLKVVQALKNPGGGMPGGKITPLNVMLKGIALEKKNKLRESALEYMKAFLLFPSHDKDGVADLTRLEAMARLVAVLKAGKDVGTAAAIASNMQSEK